MEDFRREGACGDVGADTGDRVRVKADNGSGCAGGGVRHSSWSCDEEDEDEEGEDDAADKASSRRSGSKGELDGETGGESARLCATGKVNARGVGAALGRASW
jgi:hypothetical protein